MVIWHGTEDESAALLLALERYCACVYDENSGAKVHICPSHLALLNDQRFVDGLVFSRRMAECLLREEFEVYE